MKLTEEQLIDLKLLLIAIEKSQTVGAFHGMYKNLSLGDRVKEAIVLLGEAIEVQA